MSDIADMFNKLEDIVRRAKKMGADQIETAFSENENLSASVRLGELEDVERSASASVGIRVHIGQKTGSSAAHSTLPQHLNEALDEAVFNAKMSGDNPYAGLADPDQLSNDYPCPDIYDPSEPTTGNLIAKAKETEEAALAVTGISNSGSAGASWGRETNVLLFSNGFAGSYQRSGNHLGVSLIATDKNGSMETDYAYDSAVYAGDLRTLAEIGQEAAERTIAKLNSRQVKTAKNVPIVFDQRVAGRLIGEFMSAVNAGAVAKEQSFLRNMMDKQVFGQNITIIDDPLFDRGLASRPFDMEGIRARVTSFVEAGVLKSWKTSLESARKLGIQTSGHGGVGVNLYVVPGNLNPEDLMADIKGGLYVTDLMGHGGNPVTGDYSIGAAGFWIENGRKTFPVSEVTIAGNLGQMFKTMVLANDAPDRRHKSVAVPTLRIEGMTIGGS